MSGIEGFEHRQEAKLYGEEMYEELCTILETAPAASRVLALRSFIETYDQVQLDDVGEAVLDRAKLFLKVDEASVGIETLVG